MSYSVRIKRSAAKELARIPRSERLRLVEAINGLSKRPLMGSVLKGNLRGLRRVRVGDYRIVYEVQESALVVLVVRVAHRRAVYHNGVNTDVAPIARSRRTSGVGPAFRATRKPARFFSLAAGGPVYFARIGRGGHMSANRAFSSCFPLVAYHNLAPELHLKKILLMDHSNGPIISPLYWYDKEVDSWRSSFRRTSCRSRTLKS